MKKFIVGVLALAVFAFPEGANSVAFKTTKQIDCPTGYPFGSTGSVVGVWTVGGTVMAKTSKGNVGTKDEYACTRSGSSFSQTVLSGQAAKTPTKLICEYYELQTCNAVNYAKTWKSKASGPQVSREIAKPNDCRRDGNSSFVCKLP